jgi:hypothetical protein
MGVTSLGNTRFTTHTQRTGITTGIAANTPVYFTGPIPFSFFQGLLFNITNILIDSIRCLIGCEGLAHENVID